MEINKIWAVYFSPTGSSKKISCFLANCLGDLLKKEVKEIPFTLLKDRQKMYSFNENDLVIFATPTYAGRVPNKIVSDIEKAFKGNGATLLPISVYGNRSFDDSLMELKLLLEKLGFKAIGAAGVVSQHAFTNKLANERPNEEDMEEIKDFAKAIFNKLKAAKTYEDFYIKGNNPIKEYYTPLKENGEKANFLKAKPITNKEICISCGICKKVCPMDSIDDFDYSIINGICIKCQACIKACPLKAKAFDDEDFLSHVKMLEKNYQGKGKNYFFK